MAERVGKMPVVAGNTRPVPMRLFAAWEVDRTNPTCVPRLCSLTIARLTVLKPLCSDLNSIIIAVKMQSSKRTLRSNEIPLPANGLLDTELELSFALQYPHFLKQDGNKLLVMLQRRKRYKNRTILGFKTLSVGVISMAMAMQRQADLELELYPEVKDKNGPVAKITVQNLSSKPVNTEEGADRLKSVNLSDNTERFRYSDEEDEFTSNEEGSESEPIAMDERVVDRRPRKSSRSKISPSNARFQQRNLKQKFIALLKRFKITEDLQGLEQEAGGMDPSKLAEADLEMDAGEIEDLIDELEDISDSGPEMDTLSVTSIPKPSLRPFFASSRSLAPEPYMTNYKTLNNEGSRFVKHCSDESSKRADSDSNPDAWTDQEHSDPPAVFSYFSGQAGPSNASSPPRAIHEEKSKQQNSEGQSRRNRLFNRERQGGASGRGSGDKKVVVVTAAAAKDKDRSSDTSPRKMLLEQLSRFLPADDAIPDHVILVDGLEAAGSALASKLVERQQRAVCTSGAADTRATLACIVSKIQKFCNSNAKVPAAVKIVLIGCDTYVNALLRCYVEQFSMKPPDWQNYCKFFVVPYGSGPFSLARHLATIDRYYAASFCSDSYKDLLDRLEKTGDGPSKTDIQEFVHRVSRFVSSNGGVLQIPIAEAMVTYKDPSSEEDSTQVFVPFISEVRIGIADVPIGSVDVEEGQVASTSGSPPQGFSSLAVISEKEKDKEKDKDKDKEKDKEKTKEKITPPSSPNISAIRELSTSWGGSSSNSSEPLELQVDYWLSQNLPACRSDSLGTGSAVAGSGAAVKKEKTESGKNTVKSFRWIVVRKLVSSSAETPTSLFTMTYGLKEKKQKIMRLGKKKEKEKDGESKSQVVEGINRLVCQSKTHHTLLKVVIDGVEWNNVKFFQLSSQWQTHIRQFPVALFAPNDLLF